MRTRFWDGPIDFRGMSASVALEELKAIVIIA